VSVTALGSLTGVVTLDLLGPVNIAKMGESVKTLFHSF